MSTELYATCMAFRVPEIHCYILIKRNFSYVSKLRDVSPHIWQLIWLYTNATQERHSESALTKITNEIFSTMRFSRCSHKVLCLKTNLMQPKLGVTQVVLGGYTFNDSLCRKQKTILWLQYFKNVESTGTRGTTLNSTTRILSYVASCNEMI
jgi:hypothetical protein